MSTCLTGKFLRLASTRPAKLYCEALNPAGGVRKNFNAFDSTTAAVVEGMDGDRACNDVVSYFGVHRSGGTCGSCSHSSRGANQYSLRKDARHDTTMFGLADILGFVSKWVQPGARCYLLLMPSTIWWYTIYMFSPCNHGKVVPPATVRDTRHDDRGNGAKRTMRVSVMRSRPAI